MQQEQVVSDEAACARLLDTGASVRTVEEYKEWTKVYVRPILPHKSLISGWGHVHAGGVGLDYLLTIDYPIEHIEAIRNRVGAIDTPILRRWLTLREPVVLDDANPWPDLPEEWFASFRRHQMHNVLAHALIDDERCAGTYHSFFNLPGTPGKRHIETVRHLVPVLHQVLCRVIDAVRAGSRSATFINSLNERERQVMRWVGLGKTNAEIAEITSMSESTIKHYLTEIFDKLGVSNRAQLARCLAEHEAGYSPGNKTKLF